MWKPAGLRTAGGGIAEGDSNRNPEDTHGRRARAQGVIESTIRRWGLGAKRRISEPKVVDGRGVGAAAVAWGREDEDDEEDEERGRGFEETVAVGGRKTAGGGGGGTAGASGLAPRTVMQGFLKKRVAGRLWVASEGWEYRWVVLRVRCVGTVACMVLVFFVLEEGIEGGGVGEGAGGGVVQRSCTSLFSSAGALEF